MRKPVPKGIKSFREFWPYYVLEHLNPTSRVLHVIGTLLVLTVLAIIVVTERWQWLWVLPFCGYSFAWLGHFVFERNRPATFQYPFFSLAGDFVMLFKILTGSMGTELDRARGLLRSTSKSGPSD